MRPCICSHIDGYRIRRRGCEAHAERDATYWELSDQARNVETIESVKAERDDLRARLAAVEALAATWPNPGATNGHLAELRNALGGAS